MKCHILFSWKNKKNIINLLSAELAQRMIKVKKSNQLVCFVDYICRDEHVCQVLLICEFHIIIQSTLVISNSKRL